jgi:hypothetical protein
MEAAKVPMSSRWCVRGEKAPGDETGKQQLRVEAEAAPAALLQLLMMVLVLLAMVWPLETVLLLVWTFFDACCGEKGVVMVDGGSSDGGPVVVGVGFGGLAGEGSRMRATPANNKAIP